MEEIINKVKSLKILLIGGAPRSGTTLFLNQLDSHPELLCFPMEHKTIEQFFWNRDNRNEYFTNKFLSSRKEGQQSILADKELIFNYKNKIENIYNKDFQLNVDSELFREKYNFFIEKEKVTLENVFYALGYALICSNSYSKSKLNSLKYLVFKQPFFTELFAKEVTKEIQNIKFIQLVRNPLARYLSAKTRRLKEQKKLNHINRLNYVEGHTMVDISSKYLSESNIKFIGTSRYKTIFFEELIDELDVNFKNIYEFLFISSSNCHLSPTRLGIKASAGSSIVKVKRGNIDLKVIDRLKDYYDNTSWSERQLHFFYLNKSKLFEHFGVSFFQPISFFIPLPNSSIKNLFFQYFNIFFKNKAFLNFIKKAKINNISISGSI